MILITTSRHPTQRINSFVRDLSHTIPNAKVVRRGKTATREIPRTMMAEKCDHLVLVHGWHGRPGRIEFYTQSEEKLLPEYPIMLLRDVTLRREYGTKGRFCVQGVTHKNEVSTSRLAAGLSEVLQLHQARKEELKTSLHISRSNGYMKVTVTNLPTMEEVGPTMIVERLIWAEPCEGA